MVVQAQILLRDAGRYSMDGELHAEFRSAIGNCVRGFAGDRQGLKEEGGGSVSGAGQVIAAAAAAVGPGCPPLPW